MINPRVTPLRLQVQAIAVQLQALDAQLEAMQEESDDDQEQPPPCPRCGGHEFAEAGDIRVCAGCNANLRQGEDGRWGVVDG